MADNVAVTAGSGTTIAADDVGGVLHQRVKISQGADGSATDVSSAAPLQVTLANTGANATPVVVDLGANNDVTVTSGSITATQATGSNLHTVVDSGTITTVSTVSSISAVIPGTGATNLGKAIDTATGATDTGVLMLATRDDALSALTPVEGDNVQLRVDGTGALYVAAPGNVAHDDPDSGNGSRIDMVAIAHGTNPTAVAAADRTKLYANRAGIPFVMGGHPNVITRSATIDDADGAQTDASLLTVAGGAKIVITSIGAACSSSNTGSVAVRIGFGAASVPAASEAGTAAVLLEGKFAAGGGWQRGNGSGILGVGADGEDLRITCDDPAGGSLFVTFSYYTIES
jgi:hypothetical protein